ncbi:MAG: tetratricopeptide repeat protein, partial [Vicinamibacteria bacterium]|nr:tetratricopeptide repeat protein [Vicinamibacteria bacterium]
MTRNSLRWAAPLVAALLILEACAPKRLRIPEGEDYIAPQTRPGDVRGDEFKQLSAAWRLVLSGDALGAERAYRRILARHPGSIPAQVGVAYARMRGGRYDMARTAFENALARRADDYPALIGAASNEVRLGDPEAALALYRQAQQIDPQSNVVRRRMAEVKLQITEKRLAAAHAAVAASDNDGAIREYQQALIAAPEVGGIRVELANLLAAKGDLEAAMRVLSEDPAEDRQAQLRLGELYTQAQNYEQAFQIYRKLLARDPKDQEVRARAVEAARIYEVSRLPAEYQRVAGATRITRADLAAMIAIKVSALSRLAPQEGIVAVDISGSWAKTYIIQVLSLGIMKTYPNHAFQPAATIRRDDLAYAVAQILDLLRTPSGKMPVLADMSPSHL